MAAGLGQPGAAVAGMYGSAAYGHQLEDLAALQRSTLAASLPAQLVGTAAGQNQLVGTAAGQQPASQQTSGKPGVSNQQQLYRHDSRGTFFSTLAMIFCSTSKHSKCTAFNVFYPLSKRMKFSEIYFLRKTFRFSSFLRMLLYFHLLSMSRDRNIVVDSIFISALSNIKYVH